MGAEWLHDDRTRSGGTVARSARVGLVLSRHRGAADRGPLVHRRRGPPGGTPRGGRQRAVVAQRLGGSAGILGTTLTLDGAPHTVVGIAPAAFTETWRVDAWVPLAMQVDPAARGNFLLVFGRMREGVTLHRPARAGRSGRRHVPHSIPTISTASMRSRCTTWPRAGPRQALWILLGTTAWCCSSRARTSPICCSPARSRGSGKWRCERRSARSRPPAPSARH